MNARQRSSDSGGSEKVRSAILEQIQAQDALLAQLEPMSAQKVLKNQETVTAIRLCNRELKKLFNTLIQELNSKDRIIEELLAKVESLETTPKTSPIPTFQPSTTTLTQPLQFEPLQLPHIQ